MSGAITYAAVGGPPVDWHNIIVRDADGNELSNIVEVNAAEGWCVRYATDSRGDVYLDGEQFARERLEGVFTIERRQ